jgi:hypothetical protein
MGSGPKRWVNGCSHIAKTLPVTGIFRGSRSFGNECADASEQSHPKSQEPPMMTVQ